MPDQMRTVTITAYRLGYRAAVADQGKTAEQLWLANNIRDRRLSAQLSQNDVAAAMSAAGHRWHQATVYKVENAARGLSVHEGFDLASILTTDLRFLLARPDQSQRMWVLKNCAGEVVRHHRGVADEVSMLARAREVLAREVTAQDADAAVDVGETLTHARAVLTDLSVDSAVQAGLTRSAGGEG